MCALCPILFFVAFHVPCYSHPHSHTWNNRRIIRFFPSSADPFWANDSISTFFTIFLIWCGDGVENINKFVQIRFVGGRWHIRSRLYHRQMVMLDGSNGLCVLLFFFPSFYYNTQFHVSNSAPLTVARSMGIRFCAAARIRNHHSCYPDQQQQITAAQDSYFCSSLDNWANRINPRFMNWICRCRFIYARTNSPFPFYLIFSEEIKRRCPMNRFIEKVQTTF